MYLNSRLKRLVSLKYEIKLTLKVDGANEMKMEYRAVKKIQLLTMFKKLSLRNTVTFTEKGYFYEN